jgi:hypothetical protein
MSERTVILERLIRALAPLALMGGTPMISLAYPECNADMVVWKHGLHQITVAQVREARAAIIAAGGLPKPTVLRARGRFT